VIGSFTVKSLEDTYHLCDDVPSDSHNLAIAETHDRSALAVHGRTSSRGRGVILEEKAVREAVVVLIQEQLRRNNPIAGV